MAGGITCRMIYGGHWGFISSLAKRRGRSIGDLSVAQLLLFFFSSTSSSSGSTSSFVDRSTPLMSITGIGLAMIVILG